MFLDEELSVKVYIFAALGAVISFAAGNIVGLGFYLAALLVIYYYLLSRGLLFIQSYLFLKVFWQTSNIGMANYAANELGVFASTRYIVEAMTYANRSFGGAQLPVIEQAKDIGFVSENWSK